MDHVQLRKQVEATAAQMRAEIDRLRPIVSADAGLVADLDRSAADITEIEETFAYPRKPVETDTNEARRLQSALTALGTTSSIHLNGVQVAAARYGTDARKVGGDDSD